MLRALPPKSILAILPLLSFQAMTEEKADDGYPAPPGVYGQAEILENAHLNMGTGSPYVVIENEQKKTEPQSPQPEQNSPVAVTEQYPFEQQTSLAPAQQTKNATSQPTDRYIYQRPSETINNYPDAKVIQKKYQEAKQYPFEQWGDIPVSQSGNYGPDYGSEAVPIDSNPWKANDRQGGYSAYNDQNSINRHFNLLPNNMNMPFNNDRQPRYNKGGNMMDQFLGNRGSAELMLPPNTYLQPAEQFPVPNMPPHGNMYSVPGSNQTLLPPGSNFQFMHRIPEEDIIYPPSYPGRRR